MSRAKTVRTLLASSLFLTAVASAQLSTVPIPANGNRLDALYLAPGNLNINAIDFPWNLWGPITGVLGRPAAAPGSQITSYTSFGNADILYLTPVAGLDHIEQLLGPAFPPADLTVHAAGSVLPLPGTHLAAFNNTCSNTDNVFYIGVDHLIHLIDSPPPPQVWKSDANVPLASVAVQDTALAGHVQGDAEEVYYIGVDNHVHEIWGWSGCAGGAQFDGWHPQDVTLANANGSPNAAPLSPLVSFTDTFTGNDQVFFIDVNRDVRELFFSNTAIWSTVDLTANFHGPKAAAGSQLAGHEDALVRTEEVFFADAFGSVTQFSSPSLVPLAWAPTGALNVKTGLCAGPIPAAAAPAPAPGSALFADTDNFILADDFYYIGVNQHIYDLWNNGHLQCTDLTAQSHAPVALP